MGAHRARWARLENAIVNVELESLDLSTLCDHTKFLFAIWLYGEGRNYRDWHSCLPLLAIHKPFTHKPAEYRIRTCEVKHKALGMPQGDRKCL